MSEDTTIGGVTWHSSEEDGGPDVGISVYLGKDDRLWAGEVTSKLFNENDGAANFVSDGGWFLIRYKGEETKLIAKFGDGLEAREFIEEVASWHVRLAAAPAASGGVRASSPDDIRNQGWSVAVHNDYFLDGVPHTFWLFTKDGRAVRGEGFTDADALNAIRVSLAPPPLPADGVREAREKEITRLATIEECAQLIESGAGMADLIDQEELDEQAKMIRTLAPPHEQGEG